MSRPRHRFALAASCASCLVIGPLAAQFVCLSQPPQLVAQKWVRTSDGWRQAAWENKTSRSEPPLHPGLAAALLGLASITALIAFPHRTREESEPTGKS